MQRLIRRLVPAVPALSRVRALMLPLDLLDRLACLPFRELRGLPPNRFRIRVGVGNRILFNAAHYRLSPMNFWLHAFAGGYATPASRIVDLGCGCGRYAMPLRDYWFHGRRFEGRYLGVDVDEAMLAWCRRRFPADRFEWHRAESASRTYNPRGRDGGPVRLPAEDGSRDFVMANSLFSHLLEGEFTRYLAESARVLRPGGVLMLSAFCLEHVDRSSASRWSFRHRAGGAWIESPRYPEAAVAYPERWLTESCRAAGFEGVEVLASTTQTVLVCRR